MRRWVLRTAAIAAILAATLISAYACRRSIAGALVERYFATFGVTSKIEVTRLDLDAVTARVRLGLPASPDATGTLDASIGWAGLTPGVRSLQVTGARVVTRFNGRRLSLGAEDKLLDFLLSRPSGRTPPDITVEGAAVVVETPQGRMDLTLDAGLMSGAVRTLRARLLPGELRGEGLSVGIQGGTVRVKSQSGRLEVRAEAMGRMSADARGTPARLEHLQVSVEGSDLELDAVRGFNLAGHLKLQAEARNVEFGRVVGEHIAVVVDIPTSHLSGSPPQIDADLSADVRAQGLSMQFDEGTTFIRQAEARMRGSVKPGSSGPQVDGRADLHVVGEVSDGMARRLAARGPLSGSDNSIASILAGAVRSLAAAVEDIRVTYSSGHIGLALERPALLSGGNGVRVTLEPHALTDLLDGDTASGRYRGAFKLRVDGGGGPSVSAAVHSYSLGVGDDGLPVMSARWHVGARLSVGPVHRLAVTAEGALQAEGGRYRVFIEDCADVSLGSLVLGGVDFVDVKAKLCGTQAPWLVTAENRWELHSLWRSFSAQLPSVTTSAANGTGRLDLAGSARGMSDGELKITSLQITDVSHAPRFAPLSAEGTLALEDREWAGIVEIALAKRGQSLGRVRLRHSVSNGSGQAQIDMSALEFSPGGLQPSMLSPLLQPLAGAHGRAGFEGALSWTGGKMSSRGVLRLENLGISSAVGDVTRVKADIELTSLLPPKSAPHQLVSVGEISTVLPVTELSSHLELLPAAVNIEDMRMNFAGGTITLDPATLPFDPKAKMSVTVRLRDIDLNKLVAASSLGDRLQFDVRVSGAIPLANSAAGLQVTHGFIASTGPGRIEISRRIWSAEAANSGNAIRDFAYQALEHLAVDDLNGKLDSLSDGRLGLVLHVRGRHDPPSAAPTRIGILDFLRGHAFDRPLPLPKGTPIDLTLDSSLNFQGLMDTYRAASSAVHP